MSHRQKYLLLNQTSMLMFRICIKHLPLKGYSTFGNMLIFGEVPTDVRATKIYFRVLIYYVYSFISTTFKRPRSKLRFYSFFGLIMSKEYFLEFWLRHINRRINEHSVIVLFFFAEFQYLRDPLSVSSAQRTIFILIFQYFWRHSEFLTEVVKTKQIPNRRTTVSTDPGPS